LKSQIKKLEFLFIFFSSILVTQETNTRLLRSLVIIMAISIGGYIINLTIYQLIFLLMRNKTFNQICLWHFSFIAGILINIVAGANAIILFFTRFLIFKIFYQFIFIVPSIERHLNII
jgi:hypothetical protein